MRILVLGGYGFVGKSVCALLEASKTHAVRARSRRDGFDLLDYATTVRELSMWKPDVIVNCAAHVGSLHYVTAFAADVIDENIQMVLHLYRAVKEVCPTAKIVNPIANCSYPGDAEIQKEGEWWNGPVHPSVLSYGASRRLLGAVSQCYVIQYHIKSVNFLVPGVYGPGDYTDPTKTHAVSGIILRMLKSHQEHAPEFEIWGTGKPLREWVFVRDLARILVQGVESIDEQVVPINVGQKKGYSIRQAAELIQRIIGYEGKLVFNTKYQDGAPCKILDDTLFRKTFPDFVFTTPEEGIQEAVAYYQHALAAAA